MNVPDIVPTEFRPVNIALASPENVPSLDHPISGKRRYIVGDRFHASTEPHKSPLCAYHDIKLCEQEKSIKTSYQESENHRKKFDYAVIFGALFVQLFDGLLPQRTDCGTANGGIREVP